MNDYKTDTNLGTGILSGNLGALPRVVKLEYPTTPMVAKQVFWGAGAELPGCYGLSGGF
jgi:hypothetical protein